MIDISGYALLNLLLLSLSIYSCRSTVQAEQDDERTYVSVAIAENVLFNHTVTTSGRLSPGSELRLGFKTGGIIDSISVREGQYVSKGDNLASLNLSEIRSQLRQAELMYEKSRRDYERTGLLYADTVTTLEQLENTRTALEMAESSLIVARFNLDHSHISAPSDGHVLRILAEENEIIAPGYPVLLFATTVDEWLLKVTVTDRDIVHINHGNRAGVRFDAYPDIAFKGHVTEIAGMADPYTGAFEVSISLSSSGYRLISGFIGRAVIFTSKNDNYLKIPADAIVGANGRNGKIFKYENGHAKRKSIIIREITDSGMLVTGNLKEGDTIIVDGSRYVKDGQHLIITDIW